MTRKQGRPSGTTRENGFKVAVDNKSYWEKRYNRKPKVTTPVTLEDKKVFDNFVKLLDGKPVYNFMDKVTRGLEAFLSPYNK
tara:strand:+ start:1474 stop:1719 length:246 start_codon:yes stop_codon:yes gene_type:complete